jgi:hypothetical protein
VTITPQPGMVLAVRTPGRAGALIRLGAALLGKPNLDNHIAVVDHQDANGTWWGVEGRPGGVGWIDIAVYLASPWTVSNEGQPLTLVQRDLITQTMRTLLGTPYDWRAIEEDGFDDLHLKDLWAEKWNGQSSPGHVVCSSAAAFGYERGKAAHPGGSDLPHVQPADWDAFILTRGWESPPPEGTEAK